MTRSISTESAAETIDALLDLAEAAKELERSARAQHMRQTARECARLFRTLIALVHRLEAETMSVDAGQAYIDLAADLLSNAAARIGESHR